MDDARVLIIGSGVSGLTAAYLLRKHGLHPIILEIQQTPGGLSQSFRMGDVWFDSAAHVSFVKDPWAREILETDVPIEEYPFVAYNYSKGKWIKNPVQNNLCVLDTEEKIRIITDYVNREVVEEPVNYKEWLRTAYGEYFSSNYPDRYTRKYWTVEPEMLETKWVEDRMYRPTMEEILRGAFSLNTPDVHYTKQVRYPKHGGFQTFLDNLLKDCDIRCGVEITGIDTDKREISYRSGDKQIYDHLINTAPIKQVVGLLHNVPDSVLQAAEGLHTTGIMLVSVLIKGALKTDYATMYIYDEDIPAARVYSTTKFSHTDSEVSSLQAEVYYSEFKPLMDSMDTVRDLVIGKLADIGCYVVDDVLKTDVRRIPYANIIFTPNIYRDREVVRDYLEKEGIHCAGRFGEWDYFWTEQAMLSGKRAAEKVIRQIQKSAS